MTKASNNVQIIIIENFYGNIIQEGESNKFESLQSNRNTRRFYEDFITGRIGAFIISSFEWIIKNWEWIDPLLVILQGLYFLFTVFT